ncbi:hypothetical protein ACWIWK_04070 [Helicobacter sp. 23-1048]
MRGLISASILCAFGWIYMGLGFISFPLSIFVLLRSRARENNATIAFWIVFLLDTIGFILSVYLISDKIAQRALM